MMRDFINSTPKQKRKHNILMNQYTYRRYFMLLMNLATSLFEWVNLPDGTNSRYLEQKLFTSGSIAFFYDDILNKYLNLGYAHHGVLDVYGEPTIIRAVGQNGYNKTLKPDERVIIYNNTTRTGDIDDAEYFAYKIYEIVTTMYTNINVQKSPFIITGPEEQMSVLETMYNKIEENVRAILASNNMLEMNSIQVLRTDAPFVADKLQYQFEKTIGEALEFFGVNTQRDKKERMIVSEVMNGIGATEANRQIRLKTRKEACKQINEMFGLDVDVKFRTDIDMFEKFLEYNMNSLNDGGGNYEFLYNRT